jgi:uncharacterized protein YecE (DUF72 family)
MGRREPPAAPRNLTVRCRIGIASWNNPPAERERRAAGCSHLEHYAACFDCVEINSSFYRSHRRATYERWRDSTPPTFAFAVKVPRAVTHECALRGCERELSAFLEEVTGLGAKLGVLLVQLPPSLEFDSRCAAGRLARAGLLPATRHARAVLLCLRQRVSRGIGRRAAVRHPNEPIGVVCIRQYGPPRVVAQRVRVAGADGARIL